MEDRAAAPERPAAVQALGGQGTSIRRLEVSTNGAGQGARAWDGVTSHV